MRGRRHTAATAPPSYVNVLSFVRWYEEAPQLAVIQKRGRSRLRTLASTPRATHRKAGHAQPSSERKTLFPTRQRSNVGSSVQSLGQGDR